MMTRITLRLPDELHHRLRAACQQTGASLNQVIVATLSRAIARDELPGANRGPLAEQVQHIRTALGDLAVEIDTSQFPEHLRPTDDLPDPDTVRQSLPELRPPLSATIIADREDRS